MHRTLNAFLKRCFLFIAIVGVTTASSFADEPWPKGKPLRIFIGYTAGSATDAIARVISVDMGRILGTPVVVENRPGAGGSIAAGQMLREPADGYTVVMNSSAHAANPAMIANLPYDTLRDISAVGPIGASQFVMLTSPDSGIQSVAQAVERAKAEPGKLNYGSGGIGSGGHINGAILASATGINVQHVPMRGTPETITETIAGRLDWAFVPAPAAVPMVKTNKLRALAVGAGTRSQALPNVPSMTEAGFPKAIYTSWIGMFIATKTPRPIHDRLSAVLAEVVASPSVQEKILALGIDPLPMSTKEFDAFVAGEVKTMQQLVKSGNIRPQQ